MIGQFGWRAKLCLIGQEGSASAARLTAVAGKGAEMLALERRLARIESKPMPWRGRLRRPLQYLK